MSAKKTTAPSLFKIDLASVPLPEINPARLLYQADPWAYYGKDNLFPQYLRKAQHYSSEHSAFILLRQNLIPGEGFSFSEDIEEAMENINEDQSADELLEKIAVDLSILESFAVQIIKNRDGKYNLYYVDSSTIRPSVELDEKGRPIGYYVSQDWSNKTMFVPQFYERFDVDTIGNKPQIYYYHKQALGQPYIPEVSYLSALNYIEMSNELSKFGLSPVLNGFFASSILQAKANMSDDQKARFKEDVKNNFTGADNASKLMVVVSEESDSITVTPLTTTDQTPFLKALEDMATDKICTAHRGNPALAGIVKGGASLGGDGNNYTVSLQIYQNTVIRHFQKAVMKFFKKILELNGYSDFELDIQGLSVISVQMDEGLRADYLKPEKFIQEYGYSIEDLKPEFITKEPEPEQIPPVAPAENFHDAA